MAQAINVTFKNDDEEIKMYMEAISHTGRVTWIKDCIKFYMEYGHMKNILRKMLEEENIKSK
ncbi:MULTISPECIES: hypothetical protein [Clostridium]|uniref:hypothetical protein n=1 Tax=Clostridium TaxID=1485 RepID=UPI0013E94737|nr:MULTISPECIES: hypothetical protein [Clostridium]MBZ9633102.1 hypothetical protein [Clostridium sp. FP1]MCB2297826.1 hypothetical protein [Clostridium tagluense]